MPSYVTAKKNTEFIMYVTLTQQADTRLFQVNPTIAAGDFKVSTDGGAFANLTTLPAVTPAGGRAVKITVSASEMNGDNVLVVASDAAGAEWCDKDWLIQTTTRQIDDLAYPTVSGRSLDVSATGEAGIDWANIGSPTTSVNLSGTSTKALEPTTAGRTLDVTVTGGAGIDWSNVENQSSTVTLSATSIASSPATLSSSERNAVADALLNRDMSLVTVTNSRSPINAFRFLRNKIEVVTTVLTVYKEDDATVAWTGTVTLNSSAAPITGVDPS